MLRFMKNRIIAQGYQVDGVVVGAGSFFWPGATMEISPLGNHAKYYI
jgi:hypothetical protein